ncbi:MAG: hypothetical protein A4E69_00454 [Syntrophus sp. PtaB.Bin138]|jgi:hypothetical protein|nr:MAG: hypothetical protein A4E69_00454 [Syntrophus sp. PtaB.Bin138]
MLSNVHYKYNQSIEVPSPFCRGLDKREAFLYCSNKGFRGNHRKPLMPCPESIKETKGG